MGRAFIENLLHKLEYIRIEDFYNITTQVIINHGGCSIIEYHKSPYEIANFAFPEYEWLAWKFARVPAKFWNNLENLINYLEWLSKRLGYTKLEDCYRISRKDFKNNNGSGLLSLSGSSPSSIILKAYPEYDWKPWLFFRTPQDDSWSDSFKELQEFKKINGHCSVPRSKESLVLGRWLWRQSIMTPIKWNSCQRRESSLNN